MGMTLAMTTTPAATPSTAAPAPISAWQITDNQILCFVLCFRPSNGILVERRRDYCWLPIQFCGSKSAGLFRSCSIPRHRQNQFPTISGRQHPGILWSMAEQQSTTAAGPGCGSFQRIVHTPGCTTPSVVSSAHVRGHAYAFQQSGMQVVYPGRSCRNADFQRWRWLVESKDNILSFRRRL